MQKKKITLKLKENQAGVRLLYTHIHFKKTVILAPRQKYRSMEKNRNPRDKSTHLWTPYL